MGSIANTFSQFGSMSHANVHMGKVKIYNELDVEDNAHFESDVTIDGTLYAKGMKMGETTVTEEDIANLKKGVNEVIDDASVAPYKKKVKLTPLKDGSGNVVGMMKYLT